MVKRGITPAQAQQIRAERGIKDTKLQRLRVKKGLSQVELAVVSGVKTRTIQGYEKGERNIDGAKLSTLCSLCIALDCKLEDILESPEIIHKLRLTK